jgi:hypothetical protein
MSRGIRAAAVARSPSMEYLAADRAEDADRARFRRYNAARKHAAEKAVLAWFRVNV